MTLFFFSFANNKINYNKSLTEKSVQDIFKKYRNKEFKNLSITDFKKIEPLLIISDNINKENNFFAEEIEEYHYKLDYFNYLKKYL